MVEKQATYRLILAQLEALLNTDSTALVQLANASALLKSGLPRSVFSGFYLYDGSCLRLGPFQGQVSCGSIALGKGVCGESAQTQKTLVVADVTQHQNYISCDTTAKSEIVVPLVKAGRLLGVLDLDSSVVDDYDQIDIDYLEQFASLLVDGVEWQFSQFDV